MAAEVCDPLRASSCQATLCKVEEALESLSEISEKLQVLAELRQAVARIDGAVASIVTDGTGSQAVCHRAKGKGPSRKQRADQFSGEVTQSVSVLQSRRASQEAVDASPRLRQFRPDVGRISSASSYDLEPPWRDSASAHGTPNLHNMVEALEEHVARQLQSRRRKSRSHEEESVDFLLDSKALVSKALKEEPSEDNLGLHQPSSSHEAPPVPVARRQSRSLSSVSAAVVPEREPPLPERGGSRFLERKKSQPNPDANSDDNGKQEVFKLCRRKSLDELQTNYHAVITAAARPDTVQAHLGSTTNETQQTALPSIGWFLLGFFGILDFYPGRKWQVLTWTILVARVLTAGLATAMVAVQGAAEIHSQLSVIVSNIYLIGSVAACIFFRFHGMTSLLGPDESLLDGFAVRFQFLADWQRLTSHRLIQTGSFYVLLLATRAGATIFTSSVAHGRLSGDLVQDALAAISFAVMAATFCVVCYCSLHVTAGLELAIDSFAVHCFKHGDMDAAISEWNIVQANLRRTSCKLSDALVVLGAACVAALISCLQEVLFDPAVGSNDLLDLLLWLGWVYSPLLLFLYTLSRAASVTEKADRLAPLINSWSFDDEDVMDDGRQYLVQYIMQSQAGFFLKSTRLNAFGVQKFTYYLSAASFGLLANLWR